MGKLYLFTWVFAVQNVYPSSGRGLRVDYLHADMVAVPGYASTAVEHWGITAYRDSSLLFDSRTHGDLDKQRTVSIVAHELAHNVP